MSGSLVISGLGPGHRRERRHLVVPIELGAVQIRVQAALAHQVVVASFFDDATHVEDDDPVRVDDRRQAVRDHDRRSAGERVGEGELDRMLRLGVEVRRGFVEDDDGRVLEEHPCDREPLLLAARHPIAALANDGVEAVGQAEDQIVDPGGLRGRDELVARRIGLRVAKVLADRLMEEVRVLHDHPDRVAQ